jgi:KDO2-lipid IV(A) lauroyltransferase
MRRICAHLVGRIGLSRFLQWRGNTILIRWLPRIIVRPYLVLLGYIYHFFKREEKHQIKKNLTAILRRFPKKKPTELIVRRTFRGIYHHYHEKLIIAYAHFGRVCRFLLEHVELEGQDHLDECLSHGRGVILVTAHFGAVEFLPLFLALKGYPVTMVVRFKTPRLKRALVARGSSKGITLLDANNGEQVVFRALQALKSNQILITECDEFNAYRPHRNRSTQFLGCPCPLDRTLDLFRRRYSSPVIMGVVRRKGQDQYGLKLHSLSGIQEKPQSEEISQRALQLLERYIYLFPEQWYQWKEVRTALGNNLFEETGPIHAAEEDPSLSPADRAVHAYQTLPS